MIDALAKCFSHDIDDDCQAKLRKKMMLIKNEYEAVIWEHQNVFWLFDIIKSCHKNDEFWSDQNYS